MIARAFDCMSLSARSHLGKLRSFTTMTLFSAAAGSAGVLFVIPSEAERRRGLSRHAHRPRLPEKKDCSANPTSNRGDGNEFYRETQRAWHVDYWINGEKNRGQRH